MHSIQFNDYNVQASIRKQKIMCIQHNLVEAHCYTLQYVGKSIVSSYVAAITN